MSERRGTKALELWCRRIIEGYPNVKIENMTTSWRDGLAFCAMIHHFRPDLINFEQLNKSDVYYNNTLAFTTAEKYLGIPALLDADDMAAYEVPDRLSILTYLSQFYQVFAAQEAHNRLKRRTSSAAEETQITKSSGPPSKMAHVIGVPKRDPCRKCQLPVFLAERLMVGKRVYHRTCLKCARCGYQLTPGSFYETETDEQYCCETCPDEEVNKNNVDSSSLGSEISAANVELRKTDTSETSLLTSPPRSVRSSIKERLAFFENQGGNQESDIELLQKSLSDEEKSKSLNKSDNLTGPMEALYKTNAAFSNFLNNSVDSEEEASESSIHNSKMETSESEDDTEELTSVTQIPELPKSLPPLKDLNLVKPEDKRLFSVSPQLVLNSSPNISSFDNADEQENTAKDSAKENQASEIRINDSSLENSNNNISGQMQIPTAEIDSSVALQTKEETVQFHPKIEKNNLEIRENNDNYSVTKDKSAEDLIIDTANEDPQHLLGPKTTENAVINLITQENTQTIGEKELNGENFVQLHTTTNNETITNSQLESNKTTESHQQQLDVIENKEDKAKTYESPGKNIIDEEDISANSINPSNNIELEKENPDTNLSDGKVPLETEMQDIAKLDCNLKQEQLEDQNGKEIINEIETPLKKSTRATFAEYPQDLNPFHSDEEHEGNADSNKENLELRKTFMKTTKQENLNPFDSSDDEIELEKAQQSTYNKTPKVPPPRPPPPRISKNPFGSEDEDEDEETLQHFIRRSSLTESQNRKTPIPTPRSNISQSQNPTPEPTPRVSTKVNTSTMQSVSASASASASTTPSTSFLPVLQNSSEFYGSANSLYSNITTPYSLLRNCDLRSSNNSLNISAGGTIRSRKVRRAPLPPAPVKELFPSNETINISSKTSTPSSSTVGTPKSSRKKRPAPAPPKPARLEASLTAEMHIETVRTQSKNLNSYPLQNELNPKLSDEEKALLEGKTTQDLSLSPSSKRRSKRLITLDKELLEEHGSIQNVSECQCDDLKHQNQQKSFTIHEDEPGVVYRRVLIPPNLETPTREHNPLINDICKSHSPGERQMEKLKDNKEANNRNRQSQISVSSSVADDIDPLFNKSAHGKWKRRKGPAPALPLPPRKVLQMLPLQEIKHELEIIEVQQQGLEKQGVVLEKMIRDRCEGENGEPLNASGLSAESEELASGSSTENSKEVENLILQLFELVNEKNELFRRQAELMYLRRQHRLEQEQADLEYEIRILMAQPERNKTDSDKAREEALIERLLEVVQLRNEVVECLEMDRLREAEEDQSIKQRLESHIAKRDDDYYAKKTLIKLSKKEKKKQKETKKLFKNKKLDADKDADESELSVEKQKSKKKKKLLIF